MRIREIMQKVITINIDTSLKDAVQLMASKGVGCLVVKDGKKVAGIITERDALKQISKNVESLNQDVNKFMTSKVITVDASKDLNFAAQLMSEHKIKKLPVTEDKEVVGIITTTDIIANADEINDFSLF